MDDEKRPRQLFRASPRDGASLAEESRWRSFWRFLGQWLADKPKLSDRALHAKVSHVEATARKEALEAEQVAADIDARRLANFEKYADLLDKHVGEHDSDAALRLKLAKLLELYPDIEKQLARIEELGNDTGIQILRIEHGGARNTD